MQLNSASAVRSIATALATYVEARRDSERIQERAAIPFSYMSLEQVNACTHASGLKLQKTSPRTSCRVA